MAARSTPRTATARARSFLAQMRGAPVLWAWAAFVASMPFYFGPSGLPQPGNALIFLVLPMAVTGWSGRLDPAFTRTFRALVWFTAWVVIVNVAWVLITGQFGLRDYAIFPVYYLFNAAVVFCAFVLCRRFGDLFVRVTTYTVLAAVVFQVAASFSFGASIRTTLFFNNPNQLGYWALLAACLIALTQRRIQLSAVAASIGVVGCAYLAILSASRSALAGIAMLLLLIVFSSPRVILVGALAALALVNVGGPLAGAIDVAEQRALKDRDSRTTFAEERGYDRLWEHPEHLVFGAGEGDLGRFSEAGEPTHEIHSSGATILFSYGIIGSVLFLAFLLRLLQRVPLRVLLMLVPTLFYSLAHQGLRFTMLWVMLATLVALKAAVVRVASLQRAIERVT